MTWSDLTFVECSILTAQKMTQLQGNFAALAAGEPGAPPITRLGPLVVESWHFVGSAGEPAFQNGWSNFGESYMTARFKRLPDGLVVMAGLIKSGVTSVGTVFWTFPASYRPSAVIQFSANAVTVHQRVEVNAAGQFYVAGNALPAAELGFAFSFFSEQ